MEPTFLLIMLMCVIPLPNEWCFEIHWFFVIKTTSVYLIAYWIKILLKPFLGFSDLGSQLWGLGNFRIWFSGHDFQDLGSQLWGLGNFRIWFSGHGFQDLGSQLWGLDLHTRGFQDRNLKNFRTWFSGCAISILGPGFHTVSEGHGHPRGTSQWPSATGTH